MSELEPYLQKNVKIITVDGRLFLGILEGFDKVTNLVLSSAKERIFSPKKPKVDINMGGCIVRGNEVVAICDYDKEEEDSMDYNEVFAEQLKDTKNSLFS